jgi:hypothetical protein
LLLSELDSWDFVDFIGLVRSIATLDFVFACFVAGVVSESNSEDGNSIGELRESLVRFESTN